MTDDEKPSPRALAEAMWVDDRDTEVAKLKAAHNLDVKEHRRITRLGVTWIRKHGRYPKPEEIAKL